MFTCMAMRAVHLEIVYDLSTDSAYNAIKRILARRGRVRKFLTDQGTNFIGVRKMIIDQLNNANLWERAANDEIEWEFNPPRASHYGGAWERMIRTVRRVLESLMETQVLTEESLSTLFCEVEMAVNSRLLGVVTSDEGDWNVLTPMKLLTLGDCPSGMNSGVSGDQYSRRRWRQVQYLADLFWTRWRREYRSLLQKRDR